ncbi:hypothetical protein WMW72_20375 [Paenibacillus filicis]|uniref:Uncharacterized protein n=1 Tax=Paenibacillus filicis TaxID=669464 RepID=A0ABU9DN26_9BACL
MNSIAISFLKSKKADYYVENHSAVIFCCFKCSNQIKMTFDGNWECETCSESGNVIALNEMFEDQSTIRSKELFNPRKERKLIRDAFDKLIAKYPDDRQLKNLKARTNHLVQFLVNEEQERGT